MGKHDKISNHAYGMRKRLKEIENGGYKKEKFFRPCSLKGEEIK